MVMCGMALIATSTVHRAPSRMLESASHVPQGARHAWIGFDALNVRMSSTCSLVVVGPHVRQATSPSKECVTAVWLPVPLAHQRLTARVASAPESTSMESACRIVLLTLSSAMAVVWSVV